MAEEGGASGRWDNDMLDAGLQQTQAREKRSVRPVLSSTNLGRFLLRYRFCNQQSEGLEGFTQHYWSRPVRWRGHASTDSGSICRLRNAGCKAHLLIGRLARSPVSAPQAL